MRLNNGIYRLAATILFLGIVTIGCSSLGQVQTPAIKPRTPAALPSGNGWWYARFRMHWPAQTQPGWYMDLVIAHQVILPILKAHREEIILWRFHRRAGRDKYGRQFSFIFYSSPHTAAKVFSALKADSLIASFKAAGTIDEIRYDNPAEIRRPDIEDTSDKVWPPAIQKSWPYYIMGVSRMWLDLISLVADKRLQQNPPSSLREIEAFYQDVNKTVTDLWQQDGRHAFMHHLNALFGYEPLIYWEKRFLTF